MVGGDVGREGDGGRVRYSEVMGSSDGVDGRGGRVVLRDEEWGI